jgi:hypothetical protein
MGRQDPYWRDGVHNYNLAPTDDDIGTVFPELKGWRVEKHVLFKGVGGERLPYANPVAAQLGQLGEDIGPFTYYVFDEDHPAIWISGASEIAFEDIIRNRRVGIYLGVARRGSNHMNNDDASYCMFRNVSIDVIGSSANYLHPDDDSKIIQEIKRVRPDLAPLPVETNRNIFNPLIEDYVHKRVGPCVYSEKGLNVRFENCVFNTTHLEQRSENDPSLSDIYRGYSDNRACVLAKTPTVISISNCVFKTGNFKYYGSIYAEKTWHSHTFALDIHDCMFEGEFRTQRDITPGVDITPKGGITPQKHITPVGPLVHLIGAYDGSAFIENIGAGDVNADADVKVEGGEQVAGAVVCINVNTVIGPATVLNIPSTQRWQNIPWTLARQRQVGFWQGRVSAQHDSARRAFSPVAARFENLVKQDPSTWPRNGSRQPDIHLSMKAPDGTLGAVRLSPRHPPSAVPERQNISRKRKSNNKVMLQKLATFMSVP